ncbi:MAG: hypothetical protein EOM50_06180 [Erysipelotrichia bacterium]|nr:hypothetical protein [Erysipelotrichia bacterium]NCC54867.1 hypothetical protein [Erysipelotrichia bacterium]
MTNTIIAKQGIENYAVLDGFISKKGIKANKINTKNGELDKVTFTLITRDISEKLMKLLNLKESDILVLKGKEGKQNYACINIEALSYNAVYCKSLKPNNRVQLLGEFKKHEYNGRTIFNFLLSTKPLVVV